MEKAVLELGRKVSRLTVTARKVGKNEFVFTSECAYLEKTNQQRTA